METQRLRTNPIQSIARITRAACLASLLVPASTTAQQPERFSLGSCRDSCGLSLVLEAELGGRYDEFVEVVDLRTNRVVGSQRFDFELTHFLEPGLIGRVHITESASVRFRVYRVVPEADPRR